MKAITYSLVHEDGTVRWTFTSEEMAMQAQYEWNFNAPSNEKLELKVNV